MRWLLAAGGVIGVASAQTPAGSLDPLVLAASAYVERYEEQLTSVVADETYTQHVRAQSPPDRGMPRSRTITSEIFFFHVPGFDWMAMRDVAAVNGRPLHALDRPDLKNALRRASAPEVARQFKTYNSRFNLGRVVRNFNEPTLALLVLDPKHRERFAFKRTRASRIGGVAAQTFAFREVAAPTLIQSLDGKPVFARGEITVERDTGRVRRTLLALEIGSVQMTLSTTYAGDARLNMLVPVRFGEHYQDGIRTNAQSRMASGDVYEEIVCEAKYSNFRRFEVKAIIR